MWRRWLELEARLNANLEDFGGADVFTAEDSARAIALRERFAAHFAEIFDSPNAPRTVVIVPSITFCRKAMSRIAGLVHYEERLLCLLLLLRMPRTRVVYVTSLPIDGAIADYYLHLLAGVPAQHARERLVLLSCHDGSDEPLTAKILARPRLIRRIKDAVQDPGAAHLSFFTVTPLEKRLALALDLPIYGCDPSLACWGTKSGSRKLFKEAGLPMPAGFEDLRDADDLAEALAALKRMRPGMRRAAVKLNDGFSGEGNAIFAFPGNAKAGGCANWVLDKLPRLKPEAGGLSFEAYIQEFTANGGIVEEFLEGDGKRSPSAQFRVDPLGRLQTISTHDQELGGQQGQVFLGCRFPADDAYRLDIQELGLRAGQALAGKGVLGRFGVDFVSVPEGGGWRHYAIEINLRKGGTTHPFLMLQFLTDGVYDPATGLFFTPTGQPCFYYSSDNLHSDRYRGLSPHDLIDIAATNGLHFNGATREGVMFHLIGALSEHGKLGLLSIAGSPERAHAGYLKTVEILDRETAR
jgi:hypothetical protein